MKLSNALDYVGRMVRAGAKGTFTLTVSAEEKKTLFVIDTDHLTIATDHKYDWEAGQELARALVKGYEVAALTWKGTDRV